LLSFIALAWTGRGGAISYDAAAPAIRKLLEHYVPLLCILAGFYFSERNMESGGNQTSTETLFFAVAIMGIWSSIPPVLITFSGTIESAVRLLESVGIIGTSLGSACLAFYFSKTGKTEKSV
jgi:hypothetical protein